jgi:DNA-binding CsgD family transcriptional regulator
MKTPPLLNSELDSRELEIVRLASEGYSSNKTGEKLCIGKKNMQRLRGIVFIKLGAANMTHAVGIAYRKKQLK